jgi:hypothetical protein
MEQVAHQAVAMQFILEMASTSQQDPRGCFRHFFHKAKVSLYLSRALFFDSDWNVGTRVFFNNAP